MFSLIGADFPRGDVTILSSCELQTPRLGFAFAGEVADQHAGMRQATGRDALKHEKFAEVTPAFDQAPAVFIRSLAICLLLGLGIWIAGLSLLA